MGRRIDYFLTIASPWVYLGHRAFEEIAKRHRLDVTYRPMPVRRLFDETGGLPLPKRHPARQRYRLLELQRWREKRGLPLDLQPRHPLLDPMLADGVVMAAAVDGADPGPFVALALAGVWAEGLDLADPETVRGLATACGLDGALVEHARGSDVAERYDINLRAAIEAGAFGAPTYLLDGEAFWGQDRLELLDDALRACRDPYRPEI